MKNLAVLVSGNGSNLQAILDAEAKQQLSAHVRLVISNVDGVHALERARAANVETLVLPHRSFATREAYDDALGQALRSANIDFVALAGFMRIVSSRLLEAFPSRVINIHPSLLPAFPGLHAQRQALEHGVKVSGCTVHFVDVGCDSGAIIAQAAVPVLDGDDEAALTARILVEEHRLFPRALQLFAEGRIELEGRQVRVRNG